MTNAQLKEFLSKYPDDMEIKLNTSDTIPGTQIIDFDDENIILTSDTAYSDDSFPEDEWDNEDGKVVLGDGKLYLLFNPIIL